MTQQQLIQSFLAFNINAFNNSIYIVETNMWLILSVIGAVFVTFLNIKEEIENYVIEEQNII